MEPVSTLVDIGYQALVATRTDTYGTGNASIDSWYTSSSGSGWTAPLKVSSESSDPAASAQNNLDLAQVRALFEQHRLTADSAPATLGF